MDCVVNPPPALLHPQGAPLGLRRGRACGIESGGCCAQTQQVRWELCSGGFIVHAAPTAHLRQKRVPGQSVCDGRGQDDVPAVQRRHRLPCGWAGGGAGSCLGGRRRRQLLGQATTLSLETAYTASPSRSPVLIIVVVVLGPAAGGGSSDLCGRRSCACAGACPPAAACGPTRQAASASTHEYWISAAVMAVAVGAGAEGLATG